MISLDNLTEGRHRSHKLRQSHLVDAYTLKGPILFRLLHLDRDFLLPREDLQDGRPQADPHAIRTVAKHQGITRLKGTIFAKLLDFVYLLLVLRVFLQLLLIILRLLLRLLLRFVLELLLHLMASSLDVLLHLPLNLLLILLNLL